MAEPPREAAFGFALINASADTRRPGEADKADGRLSKLRLCTIAEPADPMAFSMALPVWTRAEPVLRPMPVMPGRQAPGSDRARCQSEQWCQGLGS